MEELHIISEKQQADLLKRLESSCGLILPGEQSGLDPLTFHIYQKKHHKNKSDRRIFLIRWGLHQVFQQKHLPEFPIEQIENILGTVIQKNCSQIKKTLIEQCRGILNDAVTLKLEPTLNAQNILLITTQLKICKTRTRGSNDFNSGWPNYCVFLSWTDENGDFQEFIYPLKFNEQERQFIIPAEDIVTQFKRYRDTPL